MPITPSAVLALDVGSKRVGLAIAGAQTNLARPLKTLVRGDSFFDELHDVIADESVSALVIGLPRGLDGQHTAQTKAVEDFVAELSEHIDLPVHMQDEALTSKQAEAELQARGKIYAPADIDALAATYILEDFLASKRELQQSNG